MQALLAVTLDDNYNIAVQSDPTIKVQIVGIGQASITWTTSIFDPRQPLFAIGNITPSGMANQSLLDNVHINQPGTHNVLVWTGDNDGNYGNRGFTVVVFGTAIQQ